MTYDYDAPGDMASAMRRLEGLERDYSELKRSLFRYGPDSVGHRRLHGIDSHIPRNNWSATTAPVATNDSSSGYGVGSQWLDTTNNHVYTCLSAAVGAAVWDQLDTSGSIAQIASNVAGGSVASITFASIAGTYNHLMVIYQGRGDTAATNTSVRAQFNADTGANYDDQYVAGTAATASAAEDIGATNTRVGWVSAANATANMASGGVIFIPSYAATTFQKVVVVTSGFHGGTTTGTEGAATVSGYWRNTAAITSIKFFPNAGNFIAGTAFYLYGVT